MSNRKRRTSSLSIVWAYEFSPNMVHYRDRRTGQFFSKSSLHGFNFTYVFYHVRWPNWRISFN